jgi:hypothetical protein
MRSICAAVLVVAAMVAPLSGQGRGRSAQDRIPPAQMPPAGSCRVWYDGTPPGQQPPPMSCRDAERIALRSREARVVYGNDSRYNDREWERDHDWDRRSERGRDPADSRNESRYPYRVNSAAYENGYRDGVEKGHDDAKDRDSFDPVRHSRYRTADRGYNSRDGSKNDYKLVYRDGFEAGYRDGYSDRRLEDRDRDGGLRIPWPF